MAAKVCRKCGCEDLELRKSGKLTGLYCTQCGAWVEWVGKQAAEKMVDGDEPCDYCEQDYVIPKAYDGGITSWEIIDAAFCPVCGRKL